VIPLNIFFWVTCYSTVAISYSTVASDTILLNNSYNTVAIMNQIHPYQLYHFELLTGQKKREQASQNGRVVVK